MPQQPPPRRPLARQLQDQPEYAPWDASPDPSPGLRARAESGLERFLRSVNQDPEQHDGDKDE
ncbi:hypothetical protein [Streptomyces sp. NBC_01233]|uniref:hypothetical protein n=1 Tax=Streptomyces sp. NBC_01233 TaxID=2903787 RepID=UPI002E1232B1|nr:hypothetical protein OG332_33735 [Streptomyces sp. NBC_01233]